MKRLGDLLLELGWITNQDLARALETQQQNGGRLGTCLMEVEALSERRLGQALAQQMGVDPIKPIDLANVPEGISGLLSPRLASRLMAVPYRLLGSDLWVALLDAGNLTALDELAFATGKRLRPHVASEVRLELALERYYSRPARSRFHSLWRRIGENLSRDALSAEAAEEMVADLLADAKPVLPSPAQTTEILAQSPPETAEALSSIEETLQDGETRPIPTVGVVQMLERRGARSASGLWLPREDAEPPRPASLERLMGTLAKASQRDEIGRAVIDHLGQSFDRVGLLSLRRDHASGWLGCGRGYDAERMARFRTDFDEPSLFLNLSQGGRLWAGALPDMPAHERLVGIWGAQLPRDCLVYPIDLGGHRAAVIYCDAGDREPAPHQLEEISLVADAMAKALARVIVEAKREAS